MKISSLINSLEQLSQQTEEFKIPLDGFRDEISEVIAEFLEEIYINANIHNLESIVSAVKKVDTDAIRNAFELIRKSSPQPWTFIADKIDVIVNPIEILEKLSEVLRIISDNQTKLGQLEVLLRLEFFFDSKIDSVLSGLELDNPVFKQLVDLVVEKLKLLSDDSLLLIWSRLRASFSRDKTKSRYFVYDDIIPASFWEETTDISVIRERYAKAVAMYKPFTAKRMTIEGSGSFPLSFLGLTRVLAFSSAGSSVRVSSYDLLIIRCIGRIIALYELITYKDPQELAKAINANSKGLIFEGEYYSSAKKTFEPLRNSINYTKPLLSAFKQLASYCENQFISDSKIERALFQYKLGQEIIAPVRNKEIKASSELKLQKEISKFLVERDVLSYGTKYGRSEIDLYTKGEGGEDFVVEVKVYKGSRASEGTIKKNLVQLLSYMDLHRQPRGILTIINMTSDTVLAPKKWLRGRLWVIAVNLCPKSPSKRSRLIEIIESTDSKQIVEFVNL